MDIEGAEPLALRGFDVNRFEPELICIEAKPPNREMIRKYFADHGYEQIEKYLEYDMTNDSNQCLYELPLEPANQVERYSYGSPSLDCKGCRCSPHGGAV